MTCGINVQHEAGYICSMLFIIPDFRSSPAASDMAKLDMRSGLERLSYAVMIVLIATDGRMADGARAAPSNR